MVDNESLQKPIQDALARNWSVAERDISVQVSGSRVTLTNWNVKSW